MGFHIGCFDSIGAIIIIHCNIAILVKAIVTTTTAVSAGSVIIVVIVAVRVRVTCWTGLCSNCVSCLTARRKGVGQGRRGGKGRESDKTKTSVSLTVDGFHPV